VSNTDKAPSSARDQIFDHQSNAVQYYLDQKVRFNTQAAFLRRPSDEVVQKLARLMTLTIDPSAPTRLSNELLKKLANSKRVIRLSNQSKSLTEKLRMKYGFIRLALWNDPWLKEKKNVDAALHREKTNRRNRMLDKARKRHFRNADTATIEAQFADASISAPNEDVKPVRPLKYNFPERALVVRLTCEPVADLTDHEKHIRRIEAVRARAALCIRQESQRRGKPRLILKEEEPEIAPEECNEDKRDLFPTICKPTQCTFCLGDEAKSYEERNFEYSRPNKMMNHVETAHLSKYTSDDEVPCEHPQCTASKLTLPSIMAFKRHTADVHKIFLRP